ncbi:transmembrane protein, putative [Rhizoctonia solani AG-3 Rhs1AP]|uniref:Transmembrane protein, putative n=1 Tax=Rhizoctonia solani AG-3 Rhs1AP TaxID=1086054 RepID=A0A0A1UJS9_9AGAM|nr:transmembrane protein, putative [Rhizoctonia solani AG-3 Rhs1AP]
MSTHDITIDDGCPLITYSGDWNDSTNEDILDQYWLNTYHSTSEAGASASFKFTGTAVYLYGSKRPSHGSYEVDIDGVSIGQFDGSSKSIENMALLAKAEGLTWGEHIVTITNSGTDEAFLDLDQIKWTTGKPGLTAITNTTQIDDAGDSTLVSYTPTGSWSTADPTGQTGSYHQNTIHATSTQGSTVSIQFSGNAIYVYGSTDSSSGTYSVKIDRQSATSLQGSTSTFRQPALLFYADGLDSRDHKLTLTNQEQGSILRFDYAVASTWTEGTASSPEVASSTPGPVNAGHTSRTAVIAGSVVGGVVGCMLLVLFALCCLRLRRAAKMDETKSDVKIIIGDGEKTKPRPLSAFSWNPQRAWLRDSNRPVSAVSGVSGASGPGMAGVGAHSTSGWEFRRRSAQQFDGAEKSFSSDTLMPPSR